MRGVGSQVKRGLHRDYLQRSDELATVRGRIDISRTVAARSTTRGRLVCEFDEYESDTPHNQALKSVIVLLIRHGEVTIAAKGCAAPAPPLPGCRDVGRADFDPLERTHLSPRQRHLSAPARRLRAGRPRAPPYPGHRNRQLASWVSDDAMSRLYERFLREYYACPSP